MAYLSRNMQEGAYCETVTYRLFVNYNCLSWVHMNNTLNARNDDDDDNNNNNNNNKFLDVMFADCTHEDY